MSLPDYGSTDETNAGKNRKFSDKNPGKNSKKKRTNNNNKNNNNNNINNNNNNEDDDDDDKSIGNKITRSKGLKSFFSAFGAKDKDSKSSTAYGQPLPPVADDDKMADKMADDKKMATTTGSKQKNYNNTNKSSSLSGVVNPYFDAKSPTHAPWDGLADYGDQGEEEGVARKNNSVKNAALLLPHLSVTANVAVADSNLYDDEEDEEDGGHSDEKSSEKIIGGYEQRRISGDVISPSVPERLETEGGGRRNANNNSRINRTTPVKKITDRTGYGSGSGGSNSPGIIKMAVLGNNNNNNNNNDNNNNDNYNNPPSTIKKNNPDSYSAATTKKKNNNNTGTEFSEPFSTVPVSGDEKKPVQNNKPTRFLSPPRSSNVFNINDGQVTHGITPNSSTSTLDSSMQSAIEEGRKGPVDTHPLLLTGGPGGHEGAGEMGSGDADGGNGGLLGGGENEFRILGEIVLPFLMAGLGCVLAGFVFGIVKHWSVFENITEVFILVPALLGLKGNLEMTLASRLSTQANLGNIDERSDKWSIIGGNLALTQVQATVVGLLAALFAITLGWIIYGKFDLMNSFLLCSASVLTAIVASFVLGSIMIIVVLLSRRFHINPDNVATPIAASLGDLTTISLLASISQLLYICLETQKWLTPTLLVGLLMLIPLWWYISHHNKFTNSVLYTGWVPVIGAMVISSLGGLVLDSVVLKYESMAVFQPVINGVGGNLVAVQASRLSTALHRVSVPGKIPENFGVTCPNPCSTFCASSSSSRTARVLLGMVVPGHMIFMAIIFFLERHSNPLFKITLPFAAIYLFGALLQVFLLLYTAQGLVNLLWIRGHDPDNSSIPYLTAIGDLLGTILLALTFFIVSKIDHELVH